MATYTGSVVSVKTHPNTIVIHDPTPPPPGGNDITFSADVAAEDISIASAAWGAGKNIKITGTAPNLTSCETA